MTLAVRAHGDAERDMPVVANMNIATNLNGRLRNTLLPLSRGILPLFETVINPIHGLEEANIPTESGWIRVVIKRDMVHSLFDTVEGKKSGGQPLNDIAGFTVTDNGVGFNDETFDAFLTLDTEDKIDKGGCGIGRLLWLKAFQRVDVASVFLDGGVLRQRLFQFSTAGVTGEDVTDAPKDAKCQTTVSLRGFDAGYRTKTRKSAEAIAKAALEHCLWHFVREGGCPRIVLEDDGEQIRLDEVFDQHMHWSEQRAIADFVDRETAKIDALTAKVEQAIDRLQEYRNALITATATGKIDVRGAIAHQEDAA